MSDDEREPFTSGPDSPMTRLFRQLADASDASDASDATVRILTLARQFDAAVRPADRGESASDPAEGSDPPQP